MESRHQADPSGRHPGGTTRDTGPIGADPSRIPLVDRLAALDDAYSAYLDRVGESVFLDISRKTDPARSRQPWKSLEHLAHAYVWPQVVQIWTKGPSGILKLGSAIVRELRERGTTVICQLSVTGLGREIEPHVPWPVDWTAIEDLADLLGGPEAIAWRYDPVVPGYSDLRVLDEIAGRFAARGITRASYNWLQPGRALVQERMGSWASKFRFDDVEEFSLGIERIGRKHGIEFTILAEGEKLPGSLNLSTRGAWQYEWLMETGAGFPTREMLPGVFRPGCMTAPSFDVGVAGQYRSCFGCVYCFEP